MAAPTIEATDVRVLNRAELTKRLVAKLTREEAVIAGIGNTNFDLYAAGHRAQNFYMLGSMGLACPIAFGVALARWRSGVSPHDPVDRHLRNLRSPRVRHLDRHRKLYPAPVGHPAQHQRGRISEPA